MNPVELVLIAVFSVLLLGLAVYFGRRQLQVLRTLRQPHELSVDDHRYFRRQARRRLICSILMVFLAGMLLGTIFFEAELRELSRQMEALRERAVEPAGELNDTARWFLVYWILALLLLFAIIMFAAVDVWAILRYGLRHHRQLRAEHRAGLERDVARLRQERNGHA